MAQQLAFIGFGEAGQAFARPGARAFDVKALDANLRDTLLADYAASDVIGCDALPEALNGTTAVLSLVTAAQSKAVAETAANLISPGTWFFDMNSVAPDTKRSAAEAIEAAGGRYVDVAVMAPVHPKRLAVPLLLSGPHAEDGAEVLTALGFTDVSVAGPTVGDASSIKMIRSVMVKGLEALSAECALAAEAAGVREQVVASLDASWREESWATRFDYNLDRMLVHGQRRAAEMAESAKTLNALGIAPMMTEQTVNWQRGLGELGVAVPQGLGAKLQAINTRRQELSA